MAFDLPYAGRGAIIRPTCMVHPTINVTGWFYTWRDQPPEDPLGQDLPDCVNICNNSPLKRADVNRTWEPMGLKTIGTEVSYQCAGKR